MLSWRVSKEVIPDNKKTKVKIEIKQLIKRDYMIDKSFEFKIGVIGLGYVGTPLPAYSQRNTRHGVTTSMPPR